MEDKNTGANTRLAQWGLKWFIETLCFYCKFVLVDNLVFQNPPLRQAWERYRLYLMNAPSMIRIISKLLFIFAFSFLSCKTDLGKEESLDSCCDFIPPPPPPFKGTILVDENYIIDKNEVQVRITAERLTNNLDQEQQSYLLTTKKSNQFDTFCFLLPFESAIHWNEIKTEYDPEEKVIYIGFTDENSMYRLYKFYYGTGINKNSITFLSLMGTKQPLDIESKIKSENKFKKYSERRRNGSKIFPKIWRKGIIKVQQKYYEEICIGEIQNLSQKIEYRKYYNKETNSLKDKLW